MPQQEQPDFGYGPRWDEASQSYSGPPKGLGYFGPLIRPDSDPKNPTVQSEFSIDRTLNGRMVSMPTIVPTLTQDELHYILTMPDGAPLPQTIEQKAIAHAQGRLAQGKDPFAQVGEQLTVYPGLRRAPVPKIRNRRPAIRDEDFTSDSEARQ